MSEVEKWLQILGLRVRDKVTGMKGVATSVCFDLYGCIQVVINPGKTKDGALHEVHWYDVNRLEIKDRTPVMNQPCFTKPEKKLEVCERTGDSETETSEVKGPAEKPSAKQ